MKRDRGVAGAFLFCVALLAAVAPAVGEGGPVRLLKDVNPVPSWDRGSFPDHFRRFGSLTLFRAFTHGTGFELWRTDGTEAGTRLVKDIWRGPNSALGWNMEFGDPFGVELNGHFLFLADDGVHGFELWATDGTEAGTVMLKDIRAASASPFTSVFNHDDPHALNWSSAQANGKLYFVADDGVHGFELWATDGTEAGTALVRDIRPGTAGAFGSLNSLALIGAAIGPILYIQAATDEYGAELWRTDGTEAGTFMVRDLDPGRAGSYPSQFTELHDRLLFSASTSRIGAELWATDGTMLGTALVGDLMPGTLGSNPGGLTRVGELVYFHSYQHLYRTDGTPAGTVLLRSFGTGSFDFYGELNGRALFRADDVVHGFELWVSDGTTIGTELLKDITPAGTYGFIYPLVHVPGAVYFWANDGVHGMEPWRSDGTAEGTQLLADLTAGPGDSQAISIIPWRGGVIFSMRDGLYTHAPGEEIRHILPGSSNRELFAAETQVLFSHEESDTGVELWRTDGTEAGTRLLKEVNPVPRTGDSRPGFLGNATRPDGREVALFGAYDGELPGLWASDGTSRGTLRLAYLTVYDNPNDATVGGVVYFLGRDSEHGDELWRSDGTEAGTRLVVDLGPGDWGAVLSDPVAYRGKVYFLAEVDESGPHLWVSDGTPGGTVPLSVDTPPDFFPQKFIVAGDLLYFQAYHPSYGTELWRTDGTVAGTRLVKDIGPPFTSGCCMSWFPFNDNLLIVANDGVHGYEPWITDGSEEGTTLLKDIYPGSASSFVVDPQPGGPYVHFAASNPNYGRELWRTDGTEAGTVLVKDIVPGPVSSFPNLLGDAGGRLLFVAHDETRTFSDLWTSDGSEAGTVLLRPGFHDDPRAAASFDGVMLFSNPDDEHGLELWRSDGTAAGTALVQDLTQGPNSSSPERFFQSGTSLLMMADDPVAAREPFVGRKAIVLGQPLQAVSDLKAEVDAIGLPIGIARSLEAKLDAAATAITARRTGAAVAHLEAFERSVEVRSHEIGEEAAVDLIQFAGDLRALLVVDPTGTLPIGGGRQITFEVKMH